MFSVLPTNSFRAIDDCVWSGHYIGSVSIVHTIQMICIGSAEMGSFHFTNY